jgi:hypothetical protein
MEAKLATSETFCTECQRVAYVSDGARLECPVCSSPLLATIEGEGDDVEPAPSPGKDTEGLSREAG